MQLQYGPIGIYFTEQDENGMWLSIDEEQAAERFGKSVGEVRNQYVTQGPKLGPPASASTRAWPSASWCWKT